MIEPYSSCIETVDATLLLIGLEKIADDDMEVDYSDGNNNLRFTTEKYYHPSLSASLTNFDSCKYEIGLLRKCIDMNGYTVDVASLNVIRNQIEQAGMDGDTARVDALSRQHVLFSVTQIANFLLSHWNEISPVSALTRSKYLYAEKLSMKRFGL